MTYEMRVPRSIVDANSRYLNADASREVELRYLTIALAIEFLIILFIDKNAFFHEVGERRSIQSLMANVMVR